VQRNVNMNLGTLSPYSHCITVVYFMLPETVMSQAAVSICRWKCNYCKSGF